jgi:hypothetical protein
MHSRACCCRCSAADESPSNRPRNAAVPAAGPPASRRRTRDACAPADRKPENFSLRNLLKSKAGRGLGLGRGLDRVMVWGVGIGLREGFHRSSPILRSWQKERSCEGPTQSTHASNPVATHPLFPRPRPSPCPALGGGKFQICLGSISLSSPRARATGASPRSAWPGRRPARRAHRS